jgi:hypothetical protein
VRQARHYGQRSRHPAYQGLECGRDGRKESAALAFRCSPQRSRCCRGLKSRCTQLQGLEHMDMIEEKGRPHWLFKARLDDCQGGRGQQRQWIAPATRSPSSSPSVTKSVIHGHVKVPAKSWHHDSVCPRRYAGHEVLEYSQVSVLWQRCRDGNPKQGTSSGICLLHETSLVRSQRIRRYEHLHCLDGHLPFTRRPNKSSRYDIGNEMHLVFTFSK